MVLEDFIWSFHKPFWLDVHIDRIGVTALVDSGCAGVLISEGFIKMAGLVEDRHATLSVRSAKTTSTKECKVFKGVVIEAGTTTVRLTAMALVGTQFKVLLGRNWMEEAKVNIQGNILRVRGITVIGKKKGQDKLHGEEVVGGGNTTGTAMGAIEVVASRPQCNPGSIWYFTPAHRRVWQYAGGMVLTASKEGSLTTVWAPQGDQTPNSPWECHLGTALPATSATQSKKKLIHYSKFLLN